tara:strand:- start:309 stop:818 length:510 start_codon:yes stop_codon:yes gene_type:complete
MTNELSGRLTFRIFKRGLLSRVAHDLQLSIGSVNARIDGSGVSAEIPLTSFVVDGALKGGRVLPGVISPKDTETILDNVRSAVLETDVYPVALLHGQIDHKTTNFVGQLTLKGRVVAVTFPVKVEAGRFEGVVEILPSNWGIAPFRALLGAIQLQDRVEVGFQFGTGGH